MIPNIIVQPIYPTTFFPAGIIKRIPSNNCIKIIFQMHCKLHTVINSFY